MGPQVLPSQGCFIPDIFHGRRKPCTANMTKDPKCQTIGRRKSHSQRVSQKQTATEINKSDLIAKHQNKKQRLHRRKIDSRMSSDDSYAGSAFVLSPSPGCLPLPSFFRKKHGSVTANHNCDDTATKDLQRILRLEIQ